MTLSLGTPTLVGTAASQTFSGSYTAPSGAVGVLLCPSERGASAGTSPGTLTYNGVSALGTPVTALTQITASQRAHRWYYLANTTSGSLTVEVTWAGADNVAVAVIPVFCDGTLSFPSSGSSDTNGTVTLLPSASVAGDIVVGCAQANSGAPAFAPQSGQTEYLESVWYNNTGHSIGVSTGVQTDASWTGAGSICASAVVLHETPNTPVEGAASSTGGGSTTAAGTSTVEGAATSQGGGLTQAAGTSTVEGAATSQGGGSTSAAGTSTVEGAASSTGGGSTSASDSLATQGAAATEGGGSTTAAGSSVATASSSSHGGGSTLAAGASVFVAAVTSQGGGAASVAVAPRVTGEASTTGGGSTHVADFTDVPWAPVPPERTAKAPRTPSRNVLAARGPSRTVTTREPGRRAVVAPRGPSRHVRS